MNNKCILDCDFHTHTGFSDDCDFSPDVMLAEAAKKGIKTLAVTDHFDPGYPDPDYPFILDFENYQKYFEKAREQYAGTMDIRIGLEVGIMQGQLEEANKAIDAYPYDFILGSFHCYRDKDLESFDYSSANGPALLEDFYVSMYELLKEFKNYNVLGHFSIMDRYIGKLYDYTPLADVIDEILKMIIDDGKGIEINTSSFKYGTGTWLPRESILRRYRELGGEILTFGSDSHFPQYYQFHFNDAAELAKSLGFKYYCKFRERKPEFCNL